MKRIMFLGGTSLQLPAMQYAKDRGYYTILCDYDPNTLGKAYADEFYPISTVDKQKIAEVAEKTRINGIIAYLSDTAAPTAAFVANKLNLPANPYDSVLTLTKKDLFRRFLSENGFSCPQAKSYKSLLEAKKEICKFTFPLMLKPTDSSGSRGISLIRNPGELETAFKMACAHSKEKTIIMEEFIEMTHTHQIGGDIFVIDGKIEFFGFLNCHRNLWNPFIPVGKSYPLLLDNKKVEIIRNELQRLIHLLKIKSGPFNIEVILGKDEKPYIIEMAPRNGGNLIPNLLEMATGIDTVKLTIETALGNKINILPLFDSDVCYATYALHSQKEGKLVSIHHHKEIRGNIVKQVLFKEKGAIIEPFNGADKTIGFIFLKFHDLEELKNKMENMNQYIDIELSPMKLAT